MPNFFVPHAGSDEATAPVSTSSKLEWLWSWISTDSIIMEEMKSGSMCNFGLVGKKGLNSGIHAKETSKEMSVRFWTVICGLTLLDVTQIWNRFHALLHRRLALTGHWTTSFISKHAVKRQFCIKVIKVQHLKAQRRRELSRFTRSVTTSRLLVTPHIQLEWLLSHGATMVRWPKRYGDGLPGPCVRPRSLPESRSEQPHHQSSIVVSLPSSLGD